MIMQKYCDIYICLLFLLVERSMGQDSNWLCESLICDPPKKCILVDQVAQCLLDPNPSPTPFGTINGGQPLFPSSQQTSIPQTIAPPTQPSVIQPPTPTTTQPSPFAPFLNLFGGGAPGATPPNLLPQFTLPTLPTTPPPTTLPPVDICSLPPVTGSCSRARIMWYYDFESRRCERFSWSGCGNENRFTSKMQCEQTCSQNSVFRQNP